MRVSQQSLVDLSWLVLVDSLLTNPLPTSLDQSLLTQSRPVSCRTNRDRFVVNLASIILLSTQSRSAHHASSNKVHTHQDKTNKWAKSHPEPRLSILSRHDSFREAGGGAGGGENDMTYPGTFHESRQTATMEPAEHPQVRSDRDFGTGKPLCLVI
ncbi:hypothetical protein GW17_00037171 [Ensete ventricosum]|nr:hypothetical protein GW17_00037171 [Ensete ventricosum]